MRFAFVHCHGSGNDFPLVDARALALALGDGEWAAVARALADRVGAVGGDGLLLLTAGDERHAFGMRMFNADGSEAEQCLNGLRCVARAGLAALGIEHAIVRTEGGAVEVWRETALAPGVATIGERAGPCSLDAARWPLGAHARVVEAVVPELDAARRFTAVSIGNPHLIAFVDTVDKAELVRLGERCEAAPAWLPNRANVSFVELRGDADLFVRTFERGVGLTDSCGSAMAASTYAACLTGRRAWDAWATVWNRGGRVRARAAADGVVTLAGNATWEWEGEVDVANGVATGLVVTRRHEGEVAAWEQVRDAAVYG